MILFNFYMGWNSKFCFLEVVSPRTIECICHRLSTSAQRSQSLRVMKMLTPHGWMDGWVGGWVDGWMDGWMDGCIDRQTFDQLYESFWERWPTKCSQQTRSLSIHVALWWHGNDSHSSISTSHVTPTKPVAEQSHKYLQVSSNIYQKTPNQKSQTQWNIS